MQTMLKTIMFISVLFILFNSPVIAIENGGMLNLVPQATVILAREPNSMQDFREQTCAKVYVHPFEGSLLVILKDTTFAIALDKDRFEGEAKVIRFNLANITILKNGKMVYVPQNTKHVYVGKRIVLSKSFAYANLEDGREIFVTVKNEP
jgi:hypothetical protein